MDQEFTKWLVTLGVGGVLAGFMFMFYRKDVRQYTDLWKMASDQLIVVVKESTAVNVKLTMMIESIERNALRKSDIEGLIDRKFIGLERVDQERRPGAP